MTCKNYNFMKTTILIKKYSKISLTYFKILVIKIIEFKVLFFSNVNISSDKVI